MQAWDNFLLKLDTTFGKKATDKWLHNLKVVKFDAGNLYLEAEDSFQALWIKEHVLPLARKHFRSSNDREIKIHISSLDSIETPKEEEKEVPTLFSFNQDPLLSYATLEQYVPTKENQISFEILARLIGFDLASQTYSPPPPEKYNPVFIYGPEGVGKTHLLMGAAGFLQMQGLSVFFVKAETFTEHVVSAIRLGNMQNFRRIYRSVDVLIIDDIQVLGRKNATQEELFHTFNTLHTAGKQILLSANCNPRLLEFIEERLISRFEWGLTIPLAKEEETGPLPEILKRRSSCYGLKLKKNLADFLLKNFPTPASLTKALEEISKRTNLATQIIELGHVETLLGKLTADIAKDELTPEKIIDTVALTFGIRPEDILSKSQAREVTLPRQLAMYLLRHELKLPYMKIGDIFERDHSTVMTAVKQIQKGIDTNDSNINYYLNQHRRLLAKNLALR